MVSMATPVILSEAKDPLLFSTVPRMEAPSWEIGDSNTVEERRFDAA